MGRVKDLWFSEVSVRDASGRPTRGQDGRVITEKRKTARHPDRGGNKDAKRWLAIWADPDGAEKTKAFAKQAAAAAYAKKMEADAERGEYIDPKAGTGTFGALAEKHLRLRDVGRTSREKYTRTYRNQVKPAFAHRTVKGIKPSEVLEWLRSPEISKLSGSVQETAFLIVRGTFDLAVADKMRRDNPARSPIITAPRAEPSRRAVWTAAQVWRVHDEHPEPYRPVVTCEAGLGARQGEALALAEEDFDFEAMKVRIRRQFAKIGRDWVFKLPKEGRERVVPMSRGVAAVAEAYFEAHPPRPYTLPWMNEDGQLADDPHTCHLMFRWHGDDPRTHGRHVQPVRFNDGVWKPALVRAGIIPVASGSAVRYYCGSSGGNGTHILRHFFSTILQDGGVSPVGVAEFMGHSVEALPVTFRVYGHVTEETFERAREAVDKTLFRLRPIESAGTVTELRAAQ